MSLKAQQKQIVVTGSLAFDTIMDFDGVFSDHILEGQLHKLNLSFLASDMQKTKGGTAGNIAYNLGLLECKPVLLSVFGSDVGEYRDFLFKHGVDVSESPLSGKYFSSQAFILTDKKDNQIASFYPGSMEENSQLSVLSCQFSDTGLSVVSQPVSKETDKPKTGEPNSENPRLQSPEATADGGQGKQRTDNRNLFVVISPNTPEAMRSFVRQCVEAKIPYMYDPGMQLPRLSDEDLREGIQNCEILIGNDYEITLMKKRMGELHAPILITTLGEKGAVIFDYHNLNVGNGLDRSLPNEYVISSAKPKSVVDPTGAGDAFRAGFLAGYCRNFDLKTCGQMGATCAVYTVEKYGTTTHEFTVEDFCKRYFDNYNTKLEI